MIAYIALTVYSDLGIKFESEKLLKIILMNTNIKKSKYDQIMQFIFDIY